MCAWSIDSDIKMNGRGRDSEGVNMNKFITGTNGLVIRECWKFSVQHKCGCFQSFHVYVDIFTWQCSRQKVCTNVQVFSVGYVGWAGKVKFL